MCLKTKNENPCVADTDITCYKVLVETKADGYPYMTPFMEEFVTDEIINGKLDFIGLGTKTVLRKTESDYGVVTKGFIHTYQRIINGIEMRQSMTHIFEHDCHLFECKIPAGTEYYEGIDDNGIYSFASDKIIFVKKIKEAFK